MDRSHNENITKLHNLKNSRNTNSAMISKKERKKGPLQSITLVVSPGKTSSKRTPRFKSHRWSILDDPIQIISEIIMHLILLLNISTVRIFKKKIENICSNCKTKKMGKVLGKS